MWKVSSGIFVIFALVFTLMFTSMGFETVSASSVHLDENLMSGRDATYIDRWDRNTPFVDVDGNEVRKGFVFRRISSARTYVEFSIRDYNYTTLETKISLDKSNTVGDFGSSAVEIYADDKQIYNKQFSNTTPTQDVKIQIPEGTEKLTFYSVYDSGYKGSHRLIMVEPRLTNKYDKRLNDNPVSLEPLLMTSDSTSGVHQNIWKIKYGFANLYTRYSFLKNETGNLIAKGLGLKGGGEVRATFTIDNYSHMYLDTKVSLDNTWTTGHTKTTMASISADGKVIYSNEFTNITPTEDLLLVIPKGTEHITFKVNYHGEGENHGVVFSNPYLTNERTKTVHFNDVNQYKKEIGFLTDKGIINGFQDGTFRPTAPVTRLQAVNMILREMGIEPDNYNAVNPGFIDIKPGDYGYKAVAAAVDIGFIRGKPNNTFDAQGHLTRGQMASILVNAYNLKGSPQKDFKDVPKGHPSYKVINALAASGITTGYGNNTFKPTQNVSRQHFSVFLYRYLTN